MAENKVSNGPTPSGSKGQIKEADWGIDNQGGSLAGFIIQSEDYTNDLISDTTQDQKGAVVGQLDYDHHYTCTLTVIGGGTPPKAGSIDFSWKTEDGGGTAKNWKVQSVTFNGSYNDKKKYTIQLERWDYFPQ